MTAYAIVEPAAEGWRVVALSLAKLDLHFDAADRGLVVTCPTSARLGDIVQLNEEQREVVP